MKKLVSSLLIILCLFITSCNGKDDPSAKKEDVVSYINDLKAYTADADMEIKRNDDVVKFDVKVAYLSPSYYKVSFVTKSNMNEQIIIKNNSGVYVLTPALNKEFQFDSDWPLNSSHAYLLNAIAKDIENDNDSTATIDGETIVIKAKIKHKTNQNLCYMKYTCKAKGYEPISCVFYGVNDVAIIKVNFTCFNAKPNLTASDFDVNKTMEDKTTSLGEGTVQEVSGTMAASYVIEGATVISSSNKEDMSILCYGGEKPYTIVSRTIDTEVAPTVARIYTDLEMSANGIIAINGSSITYYYKNQEISILSNSLTVDEMMSIANSINWA